MWNMILSMVLLAAATLPARNIEDGQGSLGQVLYENNFEKTEVGKVPADFLVLDGAFAAKQEGDNRVLELPGAPLDTFGALFGPTESADVEVRGRIKGTRKGRRYPVFGVGLNGAGGFKLQVSAAKQALEIFRGDEARASVPYEWSSGSWTWLRLQLRKVKPGEFQIQGKAWPEGKPEPIQWLVVSSFKEDPSAGRAAIWGSPIAETPIQYDDLKVTAFISQP